MADHTIVNLQGVENAAEKFGMPPGLEARFARSALGLEKSGVTLFKVDPGYKVPWGHRHRDQEEVYLVLRGSATVVFDDEQAEVARSFEAGPEGAEVLVFGAGEQGDAEMIKDFW